MNTVTEVSIKKKGEGKKGPWTMYQVVLDDGRKASGFDLVRVGDTVEIEPKGEFLNYYPIKNIPGMPAKAPQSQPGQFSGGLDARQRAIIRQHSQSMALEVLKLKVTLNELTAEDLTPAKLRSLADYFDQDVMGAAQ